MMGQWAAMSMLMVTQSLLVYRLTDSATILGVLALATAIPQMLLFLVGGTMADRFPKRRLIQIGQVAAGAMALAVGISITTGYMSEAHPGSWWVLMVTSVIQSIFSAVSVPARQAIIPELVGKETVMNALALNTMGTNIFRLIALALSGFLIDSIGFAGVFYIMAGLYLEAVILTAFIPSTHKPSVHTRSTLGEAGQGLAYIWSQRTIFFILVYAIFYIVLFMPYQMMLPIFTDTILKIDATGLGILQAVSGVGALAASLVLASMPNRRRGYLVLGGGMVAGMGLVVLAASHSWPLSLAAMFVVGVGQAVHSTALVVALQALTNADYLGRVMSILMMNQGLSGLGTFFVGILSEGVGVQWAIGGFAAALILLSACFLAFIPRLRKV
ncbi:MAG: MFS transporter [Dehalococcoidales bacterium]|jgi:predicted MFS family arabinose efflux permease